MQYSKYSSSLKHGFIKRQIGGVVYFTIPSFDNHPKYPGNTEYPEVVAGFTSRIGGVSEGIYESLNFSMGREGNLANIQENFRRAAGAMGLDAQTIVLDNYEHGTAIYHATPLDCGKGIFRETDLPMCDALVITEPGITAVTMHADCVPLFFLDPKLKIACVAHAGWRGVYGMLPQKIVQAFVSEYGSKEEDIITAIGPHILSCCFEVGEEVASLFENRFGTFTVQKQGERLHADMQAAILVQFMEAGILPGNCTCADLCTSCLPDLFYSHRRDKGETGAMASLIAFLDSKIL
ncbi:MAG: peptidoglycan editing factor PgeF [Eubacteriales bacterium]